MSEEFEQDVVDRVTTALESGNRILAIKHIREATGKDLKGAKEFVDQLAARLIAEDPEKFARLKAAGNGCGAALLMLTTGVAALVLMML